MPGGDRKNLKPRAAFLVASGERYDQIAQQLGLDEKTVRRWAKDDTFVAEVKIVQAEVVRDASRKLSDGMARAATELVRLLDHNEARVRLAAARSILNVAPRLRDEQLLEERLGLLESQAAALNAAGLDTGLQE